MAYEEGLAERIRDHFRERSDVVERRMFGGLCFMVAGHMCCGVVDDTLMGRVGPAHYDACLAEPHAREMDFTGRPLKGMIYAAPEGIVEEHGLRRWLDRCASFVASLPPK